MRFERDASNTFTLAARPTLSPSEWLLRFVKVDSGVEVLCVADAYAVAGRPVRLTFVETDTTPTALDGEVTLSPGQWQLYVYEQASTTNLNYTLAGRLVYDTLVEVKGADIPDPEPTDPCAGSGDSCLVDAFIYVDGELAEVQNNLDPCEAQTININIIYS
jgi:hypothetical protein